MKGFLASNSLSVRASEQHLDYKMEGILSEVHNIILPINTSQYWKSAFCCQSQPAFQEPSMKLILKKSMRVMIVWPIQSLLV